MKKSKPNSSNALHLACKHNNNIKVIKCLIQNKCDMSAKNNENLNPFQIATKYSNNLKIVKYLIEIKYDPNVNDKFCKDFVKNFKTNEKLIKVKKKFFFILIYFNFNFIFIYFIFNLF